MSLQRSGRMTVSRVASHARAHGSPAAKQQPAAPACPVGFLYTVQPGDTLTSIESALGVWIDDILDANPQIPDSDRLTAGQQICIPFVEPDFCPSEFVVEVIEGDTLSSLAREYGVSVDDLIEFNPHLADPEILLPGFRICMPEGALADIRRTARRPAKTQTRAHAKPKTKPKAPPQRTSTRVIVQAIPYPRI